MYGRDKITNKKKRVYGLVAAAEQLIWSLTVWATDTTIFSTVVEGTAAGAICTDGMNSVKLLIGW
jgi:hypothetical protein